MFRFLADENFNADIRRGLLLRLPTLDIADVIAVGLAGASDEDILAWAAEIDRIVLTHDRATMLKVAFGRVDIGQPMPGIFVVTKRLPVGEAIEQILLVVECSENDEWNGKAVYLPL